MPPQNLGEKSLELSQGIWVGVRPQHPLSHFPHPCQWVLGWLEKCHLVSVLGRGAEGPRKEMCLQLPVRLPECPLCSNLICNAGLHLSSAPTPTGLSWNSGPCRGCRGDSGSSLPSLIPPLWGTEQAKRPFVESHMRRISTSCSGAGVNPAGLRPLVWGLRGQEPGRDGAWPEWLLVQGLQGALFGRRALGLQSVENGG